MSVGTAPAEELSPADPVIQVARNDTIPTVRGQRELQRKADAANALVRESVPEPGELALQAAATMALAWVARRRVRH